MKYFISPHNDDETLFGAFTIQREHPTVMVVFDSYKQAKHNPACEVQCRRLETQRALAALGLPGGRLVFLGFRDDDETVTGARILQRIQTVVGPNRVDCMWLPAFEDHGNVHHNLVGSIESPYLTTRYLTYTATGKSTCGSRVEVQDGMWVQRKLRALTCYDSQLMDPRLGCREHFLRSQEEYYL